MVPRGNLDGFRCPIIHGVDDSGLWLNRLGILLNVASGILLAPQLFGVERLKRAERRLESMVKAVEGGLATWSSRVRGKPVAILKALAIAFLAFGLLLGGCVFSVARNSTQFGTLEPLGWAWDIAVQVLTGAARVFLVGCLLVGPFLLVDGVLRVARTGVGIVSRSLAAGDQLTNVMTAFGIMLLVLGNFVQLVATF